MKTFTLLLILLSTIAQLKGQNSNTNEFERLKQSEEWQPKFKDSGSDKWQKKWFLDGLRAEVSNSPYGMLFSAGPIAFDDACHAVLWTKESFEGAVKIEYEYTRTDTQTKQVNILYIQASGIGEHPYSYDITKWNHLRIIPSMKTYFNNMNALHISYAAYSQTNDDKKLDYIRARKYPRMDGQDFGKTTEIPPSYDQTGLFIPGETYKIIVIKTEQKLYFKVVGKDTSKLFSWDLKKGQSVHNGRIGLRHMYTRSANYKNFKIYTRN